MLSQEPMPTVSGLVVAGGEYQPAAACGDLLDGCGGSSPYQR